MKKSLGAHTIVYPSPVFIIGSYDQAGKPNAMAVAWGGICCSKPPCVAISLRKATYSYGNIMARKAFTVNIPSEKLIIQSDYFGMVSGRDENKFEKSGLTAVRSELVDAPYIAEFPLVLECTCIHTHEIGLHTQFIGEILDVKVEETMFDGDQPDIQKIKPFIYDMTSSSYYGIGQKLALSFSIGKEI
ncbi:flavin reductase family protein [bacterium]|nr:flavin reductase family protein [bacterium]